ncbi:dynamin family protein [Phyllosticta capitalensis]|uniref:dynamin family protein n=1 Tax=Phyllosticta capitalensis TaxID=121624 RepID=UPI00312F3A5E
MTTSGNFQISLQSESLGQLFDIINQLRSYGISNYVPLPQIIVCGDQSSGKSSVLEAVSGVRFPMKDNLCTRFATEVILRRGPTQSATVAIIPGPQRTEDEKERLSNFKPPCVHIDNFESLVESAKEHLGVDADTGAFTDDVLRVQISGPEQPYLTLVDLPGVIHAENRQQSAEDVALVQNVVRRYMENPRSIILAVVSAKNDYANQIVTKMAREFDPEKTRTLGTITKPDSLDAGSESEGKFLDLAKNEDVVLRLGWHVLKNRDYDSRNCSIEERNAKESEFFAHGVWKSLSPEIKGVESLKPRLSTILKNHIMGELPNLARDIQSGIEDCIDKLRRLGDSRKTILEQQRYLIKASQSFSMLVKSAVNGTYTDASDFFGDPMTDLGFQKRLRAYVKDLLRKFAKAMRIDGEYEKIRDGTSASDTSTSTKWISRDQYIAYIRELMRRTSGCELSGTFNPLIIGDLFHRQSTPWLHIVETSVNTIVHAVRRFLDLAMDHTVEKVTGKGVMRIIIDPAMERWVFNLKNKVAEIMQPHRKGHPITYNHYFTDTIQKARYEVFKKRLAPVVARISETVRSRPLNDNEVTSLLYSIHPKTEVDMENWACQEVFECMKAYYKVAMKMVIDNIAALAIERCLMLHLQSMFSPEIVHDLDEETVKAIAAEPEDSRLQRAMTTEKLESLRRALQIVNRLAPHSNPPSLSIIYFCQQVWPGQGELK